MKDIDLINSGLAMYQDKHTSRGNFREEYHDINGKLCAKGDAGARYYITIDVDPGGNYYCFENSAMENEIKLNLAYAQQAVRIFEKHLSSKNLTQVEKFIFKNQNYLDSIQIIKEEILSYKDNQSSDPCQIDEYVGNKSYVERSKNNIKGPCQINEYTYHHGHEEQLSNNLTVKYLPFPVRVGEGYGSKDEHYDAIIGAFDELIKFLEKDICPSLRDNCINYVNNNIDRYKDKHKFNNLPTDLVERIMNSPKESDISK